MEALFAIPCSTRKILVHKVAIIVKELFVVPNGMRESLSYEDMLNMGILSTILFGMKNARPGKINSTRRPEPKPDQNFQVG